MKNMVNLPIAVIMLTLLSGCVGMNVYTETTAFYVPEYKNAGTIAVVAAEAEVNSSPEFAHYKQQFEKKLATNGYTIVSDPSEAKYISFIAYGFDNGKSSVVSTSFFGQSIGKVTYSFGTAYGSKSNFTYSGTSYTMPSYSVAGSSASSGTEFTRAIALDIVDAQSLKTGNAKIVYRARTKSTGSCGVISGVFEEMLEATFEGFPGERAKVRNTVVPSKGGC